MLKKDTKLHRILPANPAVDHTVAPDEPVVFQDLNDTRSREDAQKEFLDNIGHELRTPLTAIRLTAEVLLSGAKDDPELLNMFLRNLAKESERLSLLIDDLLEIAKGVSRSRKLRVTNVDINSLVSRVTNFNTSKAVDNHVTLIINTTGNPVVHADEQQVEQVLDNLLRNAIKYTPEGGMVTISAAEDNDSVSLIVFDTGIGIPENEIPKIFERFYRVDKAHSRRIGGTGLGLAIVKDIMDAHNGTITVETELGRGSTFTVSFPKNVSGQ
ncbi:MAG: ATP-binding protein [Armatimonadota bacterium]